MSCLATLLGQLAPSVEAELRPRLSGLFGGIVRAYLPQEWEFRSESETATLHIDQTGAATIRPGPATAADVRVEGPHDTLRTILSERRAPPGAAQTVHVTGISAKGRTALSQVRSRFGL